MRLTRHRGWFRATALKLRRVTRLRAVIDTTLSVLTGFAGQLALLVSGIVAARVLGVQDRGHLAQLVLVAIIPASLGSLGVPLALTYYIAGDERLTSVLVAKVARVAAAQTVVVLAVHAALLAIFFKNSSADLQTAAAITLVTSAAVVAQQYGLAVLLGLQQFAAFNVLRLASAVLYAILAVFVWVSGRSDITDVAVAYTVAMVLAAVTTVGYAWRVVRRHRAAEHMPERVPSLGQLVGFGCKGLLGSSSPLETFRLDQAIVGVFLAPAALGLYVSATAFANLPRFVAQSIGMVAYPKIAAEPDPKRGRAILGRFTLLTVAASAAVVGALILCVPLLLPFFFGQEFQSAVGIARVLLIGGLFMGMRRVLSDGARGIGRPGAGTMAEVVTWMVLLPALVVTLPLGILGVAWALTGSAAAGVAALLVILRPPGLVRRCRDRFRPREAPEPRPLEAHPVLAQPAIQGGPTDV